MANHGVTDIFFTVSEYEMVFQILLLKWLRYWIFFSVKACKLVKWQHEFTEYDWQKIFLKISLFIYLDMLCSQWLAEGPIQSRVIL